MELEEFKKLYGGLEASFFSYYKYTFTYKVELDNGSMLAIDAGDVDGDIYRDNYSATEAVNELEIKEARITTDGKTDVIYEI